MCLTEVSLLFAYGLAFWPPLTCDLRPKLRGRAWNISTTEGSDNQKKWLLASIRMGRRQAVRHNERPASGRVGLPEGLPAVSVSQASRQSLHAVEMPSVTSGLSLSLEIFNYV
jgi:hypothetical protein